MSCDWDVRCIDCRKEAGISDANHQVALMQQLILHAGDLANIYQMTSDKGIWEVEIQVNGYYIYAKFFADHRGHQLRPIDEYGRFDTPCMATFHCPTCNAIYRCEEQEDSIPSRHEHGHSGPEHLWHRVPAHTTKESP